MNLKYLEDKIGFDIFRCLDSSVEQVTKLSFKQLFGIDNTSSPRHLTPHIVKILAKFTTGSPPIELLENFKKETGVAIEINEINSFLEKLIDFNINYVALPHRIEHGYEPGDPREKELSDKYTREVLQIISRLI